MSDRALQAVLWDMDGTLVDTEPAWVAAEHELARRHNTTWSKEHAVNLIGQSLLTAGHYIREHMGLPMTAEEVVDSLLKTVVDVVTQGVEWRPGARELLVEQAEQGVPAALVTMSYRRLAEAVLERLPVGTFTHVVTGDEVANGKPHPEPYVRAAQMLGVDPARCVAIEDSVPGVTSAQQAGCHVLAVRHHVELPSAPNRTVRDSLHGVRLSHLERMLDGLRTAGS